MRRAIVGLAAASAGRLIKKAVTQKKASLKKKKKSKPKMDAALSAAKRKAIQNVKETRELKSMARSVKKRLKSSKKLLATAKKK